MNHDDIIRMAKEAGLLSDGVLRGALDDSVRIQRFAHAAYAAGAAAEREACEQACDRVRLRYQQWADKTGRFDLLNKADGAQDCIIEIRARGER